MAGEGGAGTRKSKRTQKIEPDDPLLILAESSKSSRTIRNLAAVGGHAGRPHVETDPYLQWKYPSPAKTITAPPGVTSICRTCTPNQSGPPASTTATPPPRSAILPTDTPTTSGKKRAAPSPCVSQFDPSKILEGNRILNIGKIQKAVCEHMVCKHCVEEREESVLKRFLTHLDSLDATDRNRTSAKILKDYKAAQKKGNLPGNICISSETQFGIATSITFACHKENVKVHECGQVNAEAATYFDRTIVGEEKLANKANWWYVK